MISNEFLKGSLKTIILKLLTERQRLYGYEITQKVEELSEGKLQLTWGALYPTLHKLEADGLIVSETITVGNRVRKYYSLSEKGREEAILKIEDFIEYVNTMRRILDLKPGFSYG
ncbi:MAG: helix-turn-helix transcriptional regulator [Bacteroidales bacterium]|nr:helix-turn-helix transcriptional regulator [Bacteroidales bacterium]